MLKIIPIIALSLLASSCAMLEQNLYTSNNQPTQNANYVIKKDGVITLNSSYSVKETADRFKSIAKSKGLTLFTTIDHQKNAASVNLELKPTEVIIFGNPKPGTPLMKCAPNVGIDLPQKVLITEDAKNNVTLSYNDPYYLKARHNIKGCDTIIDNIAKMLNNLATTTTSK